MTRALLLSLLLLLPWSAEAGGRTELRDSVRAYTLAVRSPLGAMAYHVKALRPDPRLRRLIQSHIPSVIFIQEPPAGGPTLLYENSFEADATNNCANDGTTGTDPSSANFDCDYTGDAAEPDGSEAVRDPPGGSIVGVHFDNKWSAQDGIYAKLWFKPVAEDTSDGINNLIFRTATPASSNYTVQFFQTTGSPPQSRVVCGGATTSQFVDATTIGVWTEFKFFLDDANGDMSVWCDDGGTTSGCGDDFTAAADHTCNGTSDSVTFAGQSFASASKASEDWLSDHVRVYDGDPD